MKRLYGTTFCGHEASSYGKKYGYLDYRTFVRAFNAVLNNEVIRCDIGYWEQVNGIIDNSDEIEELQEQFGDLELELLDFDENQQEYKEIESKMNDLQDEINELQNTGDLEICQWFIVDESGANLIKGWTDDPLFYNEELDMYLWGITHCGTSWDYVLTGIKLNCGDEAFR